MTLGIVQFPHPGAEPEVPGAGAELAWNTGGHTRKFLTVPGSWCRSVAGPPESGPIIFWGEWEAECRVARVWPKNGELPCAALEPSWRRHSSYARLQNTDPFVFGERFLYGICRQYTDHLTRPTQMHDLDRGTLILFGSKARGRGAFVLDTVLVVAESHLYDVRSAATLARYVPAAYEPVTRRPLAADASVASSRTAFADGLRLYRGATWSDRVEGMFSFVPCLPDPDGRARFARPTIVLPGLVTQTNAQGVKLSPRDLPTVRAAWDRVVAQVLEAQLALGVAIDLPPERPRTSPPPPSSRSSRRRAGCS